MTLTTSPRINTVRDLKTAFENALEQGIVQEGADFAEFRKNVFAFIDQCAEKDIQVVRNPATSTLVRWYKTRSATPV